MKLQKGDLIMVRYWFEFHVNKNLPSTLGLGCGVTAYNYEDAITLLSKRIFNNDTAPPIKNVIENIDTSTLDAGHVLPNIAMPPSARGIWYPAGYSDYFTT
jgi:hypothetical protein